ncbi:MAG: pyridoxal phosphate-dependent aminotransferase, partial [Hyphomicrobium denitrificans]|nr:pyridoxal phosphate-dependent aminotransferase [Hyphomicrobium denitrificans]
LAGARIGYAIGESSVIEAFDKVRNHYGIKRVGQIGALAAIRDQAYLRDAAFAEHVLKALLDRDVFVRKPVAKGIDHCIRVSCGRDEDLDVFAKALPAAIEDARRLS